MRKVLSAIVAIAVLCLAGSVVREQDKANGENRRIEVRSWQP